VDLSTLFGPPAPLIVSFLQEISEQHITEGNLFDLPISEGFMALGPLGKTSSCT
jgi:hypothetical protein